MAPSIGSVQVFSIPVPPLRASQQLLDVTTPGATGVAYQKSGARGQECDLGFLAFVANSAAVATLQTSLIALVAGDPITVTDDHGLTYTNVQVKGPPVLTTQQQLGVGTLSNYVEVRGSIRVQQTH